MVFPDASWSVIVPVFTGLLFTSMTLKFNCNEPSVLRVVYISVIVTSLFASSVNVKVLVAVAEL